MATKTIDEIFDEYRLYLKGLKPTANVDQDDSDWWIRGRTFAGVMSGAYADSEKNALDAFPQHARREALLRHIYTWFNQNNFLPATVATGYVLLTGTALSPFSAGLQLTHPVTGNIYSVTDAGALNASGGGTAHVQSVLAGQSQNLAPATVLTIGSPPAGINSAATVDSVGLRDGTNEEDETRAATRILTRVRSSARGGNQADYKVWALSVPGVTSASILRYIEGLGTVGVVITSGTTDIDDALDSGSVLTFAPSQDLIDAVQEYIAPETDGIAPETDCPIVVGAEELAVDVNVRVAFVSGTKDTILSGQTLTQGQLVEREIKRAIYYTPLGGQIVDGDRCVSKKAVQDMIDSRLGADSDNVSVVGSLLQIVTDRVVVFDDGDIGPALVNKLVSAHERPVPGTITIIDWS